jgi:formylglycine-generating enzyme required for sulfatase activity
MSAFCGPVTLAVFLLMPFAALSAQTSVPLGFVLINGGTFIMGSPVQEVDRHHDETQHSVMVDSFYMAKYEVTQAEYTAVMGVNPSFFRGAHLPVENVTWYNAVEYCNKRSEKEGKTPTYSIDKTRLDPNNHAPAEHDKVRWIVTWNKKADGYRLPSEAEWEYACRAGTTTPFCTGDNITTSQANYDGNIPYNKNARGVYREKTTPVGSFLPNRWGLFDMHGNVDEWCWDWYGEYPESALTNPSGSSSGSGRIKRGGRWGSLGHYLRSADRNYDISSYRLYDLGFRLVLNSR